MSLCIASGDSGKSEDQRYISGVVHGIGGGRSHGSPGDAGFLFHFTIRPAVAMLALMRRNRIFHQQPEAVVRTLLRDGNIPDFRIDLQSPWTLEQPYIVQYDESDLEVIERLLEGRGLPYHFESHSGGERFCIFDGIVAARRAVIRLRVATVVQEFVYTTDVVFGLTFSSTVHCGAVHLRSFDHTRAVVSVGTASAASSPYAIGFEEDYGRPFMDREYGDAISRFQLEGLNTLARAIRAETYYPLAPGHIIEIFGSSTELHNGRFIVMSVESYIHQLPADPAIPLSRFSFTAVPEGTSIRPRRTRRRNRIYGLQTAIVVGPPGEEIYCDSEGRVKVRFHWDSRTQEDEQSSCWVRVAQSWAGNGFGNLVIPRVGMEVLVIFEDGDPERPVIVGCLYNGVNRPPAGYPGSSNTVSTFFSQSSKDGDGGNEWRFEDRSGAEEVYLHCKKDLKVKVIDSATQTLVRGSKTVSLKSEDGPVAYVVEIVEGNHCLTLKEGNYEIMIDKGNHSITLEDGNWAVTLSKGDLKVDVKGKISVWASDDIVFKTGGSFVVEADDEFVVKAGGDVVMDSKGSVKGTAVQDVKFSGMGIRLDAKATVEVSCATWEVRATTTVKMSGLGVEFTSMGTMVMKASMIQVQGMLKIG
jgi:type VI secretion system secreted protein VgrG